MLARFAPLIRFCACVALLWYSGAGTNRLAEAGELAGFSTAPRAISLEYCVALAGESNVAVMAQAAHEPISLPDCEIATPGCDSWGHELLGRLLDAGAAYVSARHLRAVELRL